MGKWTRNQKILLIGVLISLVVSVGSWIFSYLNYIALSEKQTVIIQQIDELRAKIGNFDKLITKGIWFSNSTYPSIYYNGSGILIGSLAVEEYNKSCAGIRQKDGGGSILSCN